ncbi:MAG: glycoside hydrolase family 65 protein, partial [Verrucomicrobia bacterium]|nr:glycoside hydrolase family 65 protein [Verrucomicrobiota bacterium]
FPWQSGSNGREESQEVHLNPQSGRWIPDNSRRQRHVNAAIAYNVWQYYQVTGDKEFMFFYGAQMILEIAASWSSLAEYNQEIDKFEIHGVMGPDEYHDAYPGSDEAGLRNNAYTNIMAVWVLNCALEVLKLLPRVRREELCFELDLGQKDFDRWEEITRKMKIVFHDGNIISQFEGYDKLEEFDWEGYREKYGDIQRLDRILEKEGDTPNRYKLSKQADTLMLFYLLSAEELSALFERLGYEFSHDTIPRNIDYYIKRTSHGSTLSYVVHSWVLARSDRRRAWQMFRRVLQSDIQDIQGGTTPEGIHLGAMAGSLDLIQRAFLGIEARGDVLWFNPCLPEELERLGLQVCYRRNPIRVEISKKHLTISAMDGVSETVKIGFRKKVYDFNGGESRVFLL